MMHSGASFPKSMTFAFFTFWKKVHIFWVVSDFRIETLDRTTSSTAVFRWSSICECVFARARVPGRGQHCVLIGALFHYYVFVWCRWHGLNVIAKTDSEKNTLLWSMHSRITGALPTHKHTFRIQTWQQTTTARKISQLTPKHWMG